MVQYEVCSLAYSGERNYKLAYEHVCSITYKSATEHGQETTEAIPAYFGQGLEKHKMATLACHTAGTHCLYTFGFLQPSLTLH